MTSVLLSHDVYSDLIEKLEMNGRYHKADVSAARIARAVKKDAQTSWEGVTLPRFSVELALKSIEANMARNAKLYDTAFDELVLFQTRRELAAQTPDAGSPAINPSVDHKPDPSFIVIPAHQLPPELVDAGEPLVMLNPDILPDIF